MIYEVLSEIQEQLNQHFRLRFGLAEDKLFLSGLLDAAGGPAIDNDVVVMMPINFQEEKHLYNRRTVSAGANPSVSLNVLMLVTTTFSGKLMSEGLKFLAETVSFFLQHNSFDIEGNKVAVELHNLELPEQNNLWASLGAKYAPSLVYKLSLIRIDDDLPRAEIHYASSFPDDAAPGDGEPQIPSAPASPNADE